MLISKTEWIKFWSVLGNDWYIDDDDAPPQIDEKDLPDHFEVTCGYLLWQGKGSSTGVPGLIPVGGDDLRLLDIFLKWQRAQTRVILVVEVPKDKEKDFHEALKSLGGQLVKA